MLTDEQIKATLEHTGYHLRFQRPDMYQLNKGDVINFAHAIYQLGRQDMHDAVMGEWDKPAQVGDAHIGDRLRKLKGT